MKKKLLPMAMLAGLAGAAGTRNNEAGKELIYPYFDNSPGNTDARAEIIRRMEKSNSMLAVLDAIRESYSVEIKK